MSDTSIEWSEYVWNPSTGCDRVSPGCDHCYALTLAKRLKGMGSAKYQTDGDPRTSGPGFGVAVHDDVLTLPLRWRKPRRIFVNSMSDLFHDDVPDEFIARVFAVMALSPQHTFQCLTKRHARMRSFLTKPPKDEDGRHESDAGWLPGAGAKWQVVDALEELGRTPGIRLTEGQWAVVEHPVDWLQWPLPNLWLGVSVENQQWADIRIPALLDTPAAVRWVSAEPLLGPIRLPFLDEVEHCTCYGGNTVYGHEPGCGTEPGPAWGNLHWIVVGGESGLASRPINPEWARSLRDQCTDAGVAFFFKQWGGRTPKANGRELDGREWSEYPEVVRRG